jgi:hypothetical protein
MPHKIEAWAKYLQLAKCRQRYGNGHRAKQVGWVKISMPIILSIVAIIFIQEFSQPGYKRTT